MDITGSTQAPVKPDQSSPPPPPEERPPRRSRAAVAAFALSLAAFVVVVGLGASMTDGREPDPVIAAIGGLALIAAVVASMVTGIVGIRRVKRSTGALTGVGLAWSGLTISVILVSLAVLGAILEGGGTVVLEEDFESGAPAFSTDSDRTVDLSVQDGTYRIWIKDPAAPQATRYVFAHTRDGVRFEASITTEATTGGWISSVGCWNGDSAYLFTVLDTGEVGILETVSEESAERRPLTKEIRTDALKAEGQPNRLRIDCVGGGREPTIISGWVNGRPVVSVADPDGYDSFMAVGFWVAAERADTVFVVDDVVVAEERPAPAVSPVPPIDEAQAETAVAATTCEEVFSDAAAAFDAGSETDALDIITFEAPGACSTLAEAEAAAVEQLGPDGAAGLEKHLARSCAYTGPSVGIRDTDLCREVLEKHPELDVSR